MTERMWITEFEMNGETHRFYTIGDSTGNDACSTACYNIVAVGETGENTYKEHLTWADSISDYEDSFIESIRDAGYIIR